MAIRTYFLILFAFLLRFTASAQILQPVKWSYDVSKKEVKIGEETELIFNAKIDPDWYLYSSDFDPNLGPTVTTFEFKKSPAYELVGKIKPVNPKKHFDEIWNGEYTYFTKTGQFRQKVKILQKNPVIKGSYNYQTCTESEGKCIPFEDDFTFDNIKVTDAAAAAPATTPQATGSVKPTKTETQPQPAAIPTEDSLAALAAEKDNAKVAKPEVAEDSAKNAIVSGEKVEEKSSNTSAGAENFGNFTLWGLFIFAFLTGIPALATPCVYPMIPMTVSFFTNSGTRSQGIVKALLYGLSIIFIYTFIGLTVTILFGQDALNFLSTHWLPNIFFFVIFIIFGMSFLGMFELTLPSSWLTKVDAQSDKGGYIGIFFMAFTLALVSFSCTIPFVGTILTIATRGEVIRPVVGMFGYSLAFALPFTLFAIFPSWLSNLPKSGGWLNSVKVVLGFIEIALALKFLSTADQVYHWQLLGRDIYLAVWIASFSLLGLYLLGKIKLPHDSDLKHVSVPRVLLALLSFAFVVYLIPGLFGAPLKPLSGYLPPQTSRDFNLTNATVQASAQPANALCEKPKYADFLELPHGLQGYFDLDQALKCAKATNKPIFIDFTGHGCVNCREMEANVWSDPQVLKRLREDFVVVALYVDDKTELPKAEQYVSKYDNKEKTTIGRKYADFQVSNFNVNAQPYYVLLGPDGKKLNEPVAYNLDIAAFVKFLDEGKANYHAKFGSAK